MIAQLKGTLVEKGYDHVLLDVGGVGYRVTVSLQTLAELPLENQPARLLTYLQVREDALTLFGFYTADERAAFELCIGVQGIGPKMAMSILSSLAPAELAQAVKLEDVARLKRVPGVGMKTAERMVLELRDKFEKAGIGLRPAPTIQKPLDTLTAQVASALANLGYKPAEAQRAAESTVKENAQLPFADLLKRALRALAE